MFRLSPAAFARAETGAVTTDHVVLTAGVVGLALAVILSVRTGADDLGLTISTTLQATQVAALGCLGDCDTEAMEGSGPVGGGPVGGGPVGGGPISGGGNTPPGDDLIIGWNGGPGPVLPVGEIGVAPPN